jgi:hypothetical protein
MPSKKCYANYERVGKYSVQVLLDKKNENIELPDFWRHKEKQGLHG